MPQPIVAIDAGAHRARVRARRDELIAAHLSLVEGIARAVARVLPPCFDVDDLVGVGNLALLRCATRYRPGAHGGAPFASFARPSIRGAILESVRRNRYVEATRPGLQAVVQHAANHDNANSFSPIDGLGLILGATFPTVERDIDAKRMVLRLREALSWLPREQVSVLQKYYGSRGPTPAEARARLAGGSDALRRVHADAIEGLRNRFRLRAAA